MFQCRQVRSLCFIRNRSVAIAVFCNTLRFLGSPAPASFHVGQGQKGQNSAGDYANAAGFTA